MIKLPVIYSQRDPRWANYVLGLNSNAVYSIGNYGCLIASLAMICDYEGRQETPESLNLHLQQMVNGFSAGTGYYSWGALPRLFSEISEKVTWTPDLLTDAQMAAIKADIDAENPVMLQIDFNPATPGPENHFVVAVGYNPADENDITIADPWTGTEHSLKDYLGQAEPTARRTIQSFTVYAGPVHEAVAPAEDPKITALTGQVTALTNKSRATKSSLDSIINELLALSATLK
jgi:hypothetical protein